MYLLIKSIQKKHMVLSVLWYLCPQSVVCYSFKTITFSGSAVCAVSICWQSLALINRRLQSRVTNLLEEFVRTKRVIIQQLKVPHQKFITKKLRWNGPGETRCYQVVLACIPVLVALAKGTIWRRLDKAFHFDACE